MIMIPKANIVDKTYYITAECPECSEFNFLDLKEDMAKMFPVAECEACGCEFSIDVFSGYPIMN